MRLLDGDHKVRGLYEHGPFDLQEQVRKPNVAQKDVTSLLRAFNAPFGISAETDLNISRLADPETRCIVTGQQLTVFGGPLFTFFKIATAITEAKRLSIETGVTVVPVFWLADEDHDYDEVSSVNLIRGNDIVSHTLTDASNSPLPVANRRIGPNLHVFTEEVFESLGTTDFTSELRQLIGEAYTEGSTHGNAFGMLIARIFGKHGLVLAGSNNPGIKGFLAPVIIRAAMQTDAIMQALEQQSKEVDELGQRQAQVSDSLLFYLNPDAGGSRERIHHESGTWTAGKSKQWTTDGLIDAITKHPEHFSPNVFLRPILQDVLLPTVAYVAGPGEMAYYAQMRRLYPVFGLEMPVITPRHSATLVEPAIRRLLSDLPFDFKDFKERVDDLEKRYVAQHASIDPVQMASEWLSKLAQVSQPYIQIVGDEDPTLKASADKVVSEFESSIDRVKGKLIRSVKQKEQTALNRIHRVKNALFPENGLQERTISGIYFMNKYGLDIWDRLIAELMSARADKHLVIDL